MHVCAYSIYICVCTDETRECARKEVGEESTLTGWWGKWAAGQYGQLRDPCALCALLSVAVLSLHAP